MKKPQAKHILVVLLLFVFSYSAKAVFYWTIVDPLKTGTIIQRITYAAMQHAQRLAFFEMEQRLRILLSNRFVSASAALTANHIARETQVETDIQNRMIDARTDLNPHVCTHLSASESIVTARISDKEFATETNSKLSVIYADNSAQTEIGLRIFNKEANDILEPASDDYSIESSEEYAVLMTGVKPEDQFTTLDYSNASKTTKQKHLNSLKDRTLSQSSSLKLAMLHQQLNDPDSHFNQLSNSLKDGFGSGSSTELLEYTLNKSGGQENSSAIHGLLSELALSKAKQLAAEFVEYENSLRLEAEIATQLIHLK